MSDVAFRNHTFADHHERSMTEWTLHDDKGAGIQQGASETALERMDA